jgi:serine protease inhibitor
MKRANTALPFDAENADFGNMSENGEERLYISKAIHHAVLSVEEDGTEEAPPDTPQIISCEPYGPYVDPIEFVCNRPFLFIIHEKVNNNVLFIGKLNNPQ